jgi:hypothetical protein
MSQLAVSEGQPGNWEELDFFLRMLETVRPQENGWQEPYESRDSRTDLWERGGEIPLRHPTHGEDRFSRFSPFCLFVRNGVSVTALG